MKKTLLTAVMLAIFAASFTGTLVGCGAEDSSSHTVSSPSSEAPVSSETATDSYAGRVVIQDGVFLITGEELAERINQNCKLMNMQPGKITSYGSLVTMEFENDDITISEKGDDVEGILIQSKISAVDAQIHWMPVLAALLGTAPNMDNPDFNLHFGNVDSTTEACEDSFAGIHTTTHFAENTFQYSIHISAEK